LEITRPGRGAYSAPQTLSAIMEGVSVRREKEEERRKRGGDRKEYGGE